MGERKHSPVIRRSHCEPSPTDNGLALFEPHGVENNFSSDVQYLDLQNTILFSAFLCKVAGASAILDVCPVCLPSA